MSRDGGETIGDEDCSEAVIGAAIEVHKELGPGLLERVYQEALVLELEERGLEVEREVDLPIRYKGQRLEGRYRIDLLVENDLVVETKARTEVQPVHKSQLLTDLRLADRPLGLILNFHRSKLVDGLHRVIH